MRFYRDTLRFFVLRQSSEQIAELNAWKFHVDGVHLNMRGGVMVADMLQEFFGSRIADGTCQARLGAAF